MLKEKKLNQINSIFELEFCLKRDSYCKAYNEDGSLWDLYHDMHMALFHELFKTDLGKQQIIRDLMYAVKTFFKRRDTYLKAFNANEFSIEEYDFIKFIINKMTWNRN